PSSRGPLKEFGMKKRSSNATVLPIGSGPRPEPARRRPKGDRVETLAERLAVEMAEAWERGGRPLARHYLDGHPELGESPPSAARLIYEEICLREGLGQEVSWEAMLERFPRWRGELEILLDCHQLVATAVPGSPAFPEVGDTLGDYRLLVEVGR